MNSTDDKIEQLSSLEKTVATCMKCKLHTTRRRTVFGEGSADAEVMFIGEGPGRDEDIQGRPFVGKAGQLLTAIIEKGMKIPRQEVFIANVVKCRPTIDLKLERDRPPDDDEVSACGDYLKKQIEIIRPKVIITLGNPSTKFLLKPKYGITKVRGKWDWYKDIPVMPTYHPSYILRNGGDSSPLKRDVWNDIKKVLHYLSTGELDAGKVVIPVVEVKSVDDEKKNESQGSLF
mgnify:CR=1 FL=1